MNPWIWAIGAVLVAVAEIVVPGCYLIWIAAGGAVTAAASFAADLSLTTQLLIFIATSCVACVMGYFAYQWLIERPSGAATLNQRNVELIGAGGTVFETITDGRGKVTLDDSVWLAEGPDLAAGAPVVVTGTRGTIVIVAAR